MPLGYLVWLCFGVVVGLLCAMSLVEAASILRQRFILHSGSYDAPPNPAPRVSVLVAAKAVHERRARAPRRTVGVQLDKVERALVRS